MRHTTPALLIAALLAFPCLASAEGLTDTAAVAKEKRKKSTSRVITNRDVKNSKGTLVETKGGGAQEPLPPPENLVEKHKVAQAERIASEERLRLVESRLASLEKQLAEIEQSYFAESDLARRDQVIVKRFEEVRVELEAVREELAALHPPDPE